MSPTVVVDYSTTYNFFTVRKNYIRTYVSGEMICYEYDNDECSEGHWFHLSCLA